MLMFFAGMYCGAALLFLLAEWSFDFYREFSVVELILRASVWPVTLAWETFISRE